ncbi:glycosyltransferase family 2 protein [Dermacoccus barathri]|uniref:Glycosyltransferase 2-like domain-containing protein n=1 Tax=Dermacoccus barathri TaxID=322601 RepID=A0ABN2B4Q0_9MICO
MTPAKVTCVIPTHLRDELCLRALQSVLAQTVPVHEVIVVDDSRRDPQRASIKSVQDADARVRVLNHENVDKSASSSRNAGARAATGDVLAFLDDDDIWRPGFLERVLVPLARPGIDMAVAWGAIRFDGGLFEDQIKMTPDATATETYARNIGLTGSNFAIKREAFEAIGGFDAHMVVWNDLDFLNRFLESARTYEVVESSLVEQDATDVAGNHLSSRGLRQAMGIGRYYDKYAGKMSFAQKRAVKRRYHVAHLVPESGRPTYARHLAQALIRTTPADVLAVIERRRLNMRYGREA